MSSLDIMKRFLEPKSVAIVGASRDTGPGSFNVLEVLLESGYSGEIYPINPKVTQLLGRRAYPSVKAIPGEVDMAVIATGRHTVPGLVRECVEKGIKALVVIGQGFADADEEGKALQREIVALARQGGARILGPNTFGVVNSFNHLTTTFVRVVFRKLPVGVLSQSGVFFLHSPPQAPLVGKGIDLGNASDIGFEEALEYFEADPETRVVAIHIEGVPQGKRFLEAARRVATKKPVLILKTGRTEEGRRAVQSHSGALAGRDEVWDGALRQWGLLRVEDMDEMSDLVTAFLHLPPLRGRRVGVCTFTGGAGIIATDACSRHGLKMAQLSEETLEKLARLSPSWLEVGNPFDMWQAMITAPLPLIQVLRTCLSAVAADPGVDALFFIGTLFPPQDAPDPTEVLAEVAAQHPDKPVVCWCYGRRQPEAVSYFEDRGGVALFPSPERAARALAKLAYYWERVAIA
ncbi:MAG TPA: hypothetical protein G4O03_04760 [Dehalococcoidia bacterium]|nr:hypothetical protein [Dehalococcoidia bacterium]